MGCLLTSVSPLDDSRSSPRRSDSFHLQAAVHLEGHPPARASEKDAGSEQDVLPRQGHQLPGTRAAAEQVQVPACCYAIACAAPNKCYLAQTEVLLAALLTLQQALNSISLLMCCMSSSCLTPHLGLDRKRSTPYHSLTSPFGRREASAYERKIRRAHNKQNSALAERLAARRPTHRLDHLVRERCAPLAHGFGPRPPCAQTVRDCHLRLILI